MAARKRGNQQPTFSTVTDYASTMGGDAVTLFKAYGAAFMPSQEHELKTYLARDEAGGFACRTICVSKPRQNGKSYAARYYAIWMAAIEGKHVLFSAHHGKVVRTMFREICDFVQSQPDFAQLVRSVYKAAGQEGIYFADDSGGIGGFIEFQTRTNSGARGETYTIIVVDEAQELTYEQLEGLKPTTIATGDAENSNPQMIFLGTPPAPNCPGDVFRDYHDKAHAHDASIWWLEWSVDAVPNVADEAATMELVYLTNPAMGYRIQEATMRDMMHTMRPDGFARECLGWWAKSATVDHPIAGNQWSACAIDATAAKDIKGATSFAVKFDAQGTRGAVAACIMPASGVPYVELVADRPLSSGIGFFARLLEQVAPSAEALVIDGRGNAQTLIERLLDAGVDEKKIVKPNSYQMSAACAGLVNAVKEKGVRHSRQQALDLSATATRRRRIGNDGGFGFASTKTADANIVEAVALAYQAACDIKRKPKRKLRVG